MNVAACFLTFVLLPVSMLIVSLTGHDSAVRTRCERDSVSRACRIHLALGDLRYSKRPDGTLALVAPVINDGRLTARTVKVSSIAVSGRGLVTPANFQVPLGDLPSNGQSVLEARLRHSATFIPATVTLKGTYLDWSQTKRFTLSAPLATGGARGSVKWIR